MSSHSTETPERRGNDRGNETDVPPRAKRVASIITERGRDGSPAVLAGGALLASAIRTTQNRRRAAGRALLGSALLALGLRRRRSAGGTPSGEDGAAESDAESKKVADVARAARERRDVVREPGTNPRGTSGERPREPEEGSDEGEVRFTEAQDVEPQPKPHLDEDDPKDPRYEDVDDRASEIDLSEAAMADEASEATGPDPEQAQPAQIEDTEPEQSPSADVSHAAADVPTDTDAESADATGEGNEATDDGGA